MDIGLIDTMHDLFVNLIGAVIFSIIGYFYIKRKGTGKVESKTVFSNEERGLNLIA